MLGLLSKPTKEREIALFDMILSLEEKVEKMGLGEDEVDIASKIAKNMLKDVRQGLRGEKGDPGKDGKDGRNGRDGRDGVDGVDGKDGKDGKDGAMGVIDEATIAYLEDRIDTVKKEIDKAPQSRSGWGAHPLQIKDGNTLIEKVARVINFGNNLSATRSADGVITVNAASSGGISVTTPTGSVNGSNTSFTVTDVPQWVVADGITYFDGAGYTYGALTVTMDVAPSQYIRAII